MSPLLFIPLLSPLLVVIHVAFSCSTRPAPPPRPSPFAAVTEQDLMFSGYDTSQLPPSRAASSSSSALHNTMCVREFVCERVCVFVCVCTHVSQGETDTESGKQTDWQTGHLLVCLQTYQTLTFCDYTVYLQV